MEATARAPMSEGCNVKSLFGTAAMGWLAVVSFLLLIGPPAQAGIINAGFEDGTDQFGGPFGWSRLGNTRGIGSDAFPGNSFVISPRDGAFQARMTTDSNVADQNIGDVSNTFGIDLNGLGFSGGSILFQDFNLAGPDS